MATGTYSIMWSAVQSHMLSKYPDPPLGMCMTRAAVWHLLLTAPVVRAGHSAGVSCVPVAPPRRAWQSAGVVSYLV